MKWLCLTAIALCACTKQPVEPNAVIDHVSVDPEHIDEDAVRAAQDAAKAGKRVLVFFHAAWCEPCKRLEPAFRRRGNRSTFSRWNLAEVDVDQMPGDYALGLHVEYIPLIAKLDAHGKVSGTLDGEAFGEEPTPEHVDDVFRAFLGS